ncbi:ankyrin repeat and KH domain-containing protein mask-like isoform X2 [Drosophila albomicans]|uniref:Ankyrin repeat and KH domain-containing protein mask-like isoform X2 n=1 Tax=Drosophila albomicans TaxID=7291 RepID=A0A9C6WIB0_DROAB|nr:ankyrin repeat and KH domain-containing protein mask-like isoform X2 [Drosophila albomicans]
MFSFQNQINRPALIEAAAFGHLDIVVLMLRKNFNVNEKCENGETALMVASAGSYLDVVNVLLSHGASLNEQNVVGHTPLMKAAFGGHVEVAKRGASINTRSNEHNECALSVASYKGHPDLVYILLEAGADDLNFALSAASKGGQVTVVELLLEYGAEINSSTFPLPSPLECAISNSHLDVATLLIEAGGNINGAISNGNTYLMMAAGKGDQRMVELLLVYVYTQVDAQIVGKIYYYIVLSPIGEVKHMKRLYTKEQRQQQQ